MTSRHPERRNQQRPGLLITGSANERTEQDIGVQFFMKALVCVSAWRRWNDEGLSSSQKQPEVNFQGDFMSIMGDVLKCFKPDDCDVTLNLEANILHVSPLCNSEHMHYSDTAVPRRVWMEKKKTGRDKVSGIVITFICFDCVLMCAAESLCAVAQRPETGESNHDRDSGPGSE